MPYAAYLAAIDTLLVVLLTFLLAGRVAYCRNRYKIEAPATTGNPNFERAFRTHVNTVEQIAMFLPTLWVASLFYGTEIPFYLGIVWVIGRVIYAVGYAQNNTQLRGPGALLSLACLVVLFVLSVMGLMNPP